MATDDNDTFLAPPAVTALRQESVENQGRGKIERTSSMDILEEREDLKEAAEQTLNVILDLGLDGVVRWVSPSWKDVIGTTLDSVQGKPITDILLENKSVFTDAVESMKKDDSRSQIIRFCVKLGPASLLGKASMDESIDAEEEQTGREASELDNVLSLEAQGIM
ncbi:MAG: rim15, signal transduction response regulator, partial [Pleopsidium flavum]